MEQVKSIAHDDVQWHQRRLAVAAALRGMTPGETLSLLTEVVVVGAKAWGVTREDTETAIFTVVDIIYGDDLTPTEKVH